MDNAKIFLERVNDRRASNLTPPLYCLSGLEYAAAQGDPTDASLLFALAFVVTAISGFWLGYALGPLAWMVMR